MTLKEKFIELLCFHHDEVEETTTTATLANENADDGDCNNLII